jgi:hypothetical protein
VFGMPGATIGNCSVGISRGVRQDGIQKSALGKDAASQSIHVRVSNSYWQLATVSESIQALINASPAASRTLLAIGGMAFASRRAIRASNTERASSPGAITRASAMPRSPAAGTTLHAPVCDRAVS